MAAISQARVREIFNYDEDTGVFIWKPRPLSDFTSSRSWRGNNTRHSGKVAGSLSGRGYLYIQIDGVKWRAHRLAWLYVYGDNPIGEIDHINGIRTDNRIANLRVVDDAQNAQNRAMHRSNSTGRVGVYWHKARKAWWAMITVRGRRISLGYHQDFADASAARFHAEILNGFHSNHGRPPASRQ